MIVVDTSVWVSRLADQVTPHTRRLDEAMAASVEIGLTPILLTEVLQGIRTDRDFERTRGLLLRLPMLSLDAEGHVAAAQLYRMLRRRGVTIRGAIDCIIAQTCIVHGAELLAADRDFEQIARHTQLRCIAV